MRFGYRVDVCHARMNSSRMPLGAELGASKPTRHHPHATADQTKTKRTRTGNPGELARLTCVGAVAGGWGKRRF